MMKLGEKIKNLRKQKNISQEIFANYLGVSFQAVSKWENGNTMPDVTMIPAIASFFGISTDELFDFNLFETEKQVDAICTEAYRYRSSDAAKSEEILRQGLQRFPGNEIILNNLLYTLNYRTRAEEVIDICHALIASTKDDSVKYDACRILAICYRENGQMDRVRPALEKIPEIYFTKLELMANPNGSPLCLYRITGVHKKCLLDRGRVIKKSFLSDSMRDMLIKKEKGGSQILPEILVLKNYFTKNENYGIV